MAWLKIILKRVGVRGLSAILAILLASPFSWNGLTGFYLWLSPFIMLNSVFLLKSVVWLNGFAFLILVIIFLRKRWFCRYLCPVGWGCDLVSSCSHRKKFPVQKIPPLGKWMAISSLAAALAGMPLFILLDPMSLFNGFFTVFSREEITIPAVISLLGLPFLLAIHLFFPGIWCTRICPLGGLQDEAIHVKKLLRKIQRKRNRLENGNGRRLFIASGLGMIVPRFLLPGEEAYIRPPGSIPESLFNRLCLRCGSCIKACPTGILVHRIDSGDITSWMIPEICFDKGYCLEDCNLCSRVCSSGAITLFSCESKHQLPIGLAKIELQNCLLLKNIECDHCKIACPYDAITINTEQKVLKAIPAVNSSKCVGCGACAVICSSETISITAFLSK